MRWTPWLVPAVLLLAAGAEAQNTYLQQKQKSIQFTGDVLLRYEWTKKILSAEGEIDQNRYLAQARPGLEANLGPVVLGVGGLFNYSRDINYETPDGQTPALIRDNYRSRDARLDLYYAKLKAGPLVAEGGRFEMPLLLTEMIWDQDLRPQGGAASVEFGQTSRLALRGIYATHSHVFEDGSTMFGGSVELALQSGRSSQFVLAGSYLEFRDLDTLDHAIVRQNTSVLGIILNDYRVADAQARIVASGQMPVQLVADYCWNTAVSEKNKGLWLAATFGKAGISRAELEYTYAKIDQNATVGAFNTDDFFWATGWEGHRIDLGTSSGRGSSVHAIAQWQRLKDSPDPEVQNHWVERYRFEARYTF
jgi:hypothetical protein